jgi:hypothetical protein
MSKKGYVSPAAIAMRGPQFQKATTRKPPQFIGDGTTPEVRKNKAGLIQPNPERNANNPRPEPAPFNPVPDGKNLPINS